MKLTILSLVFSLIALGGTAFLGFDRWQDDDGDAQPEATVTGWSRTECEEARTALSGLQYLSSPGCRPNSAEACVQLQLAIIENCR